MNLTQELRKANFEHLHSIWKLAREGAVDSLSGEDQRIAEIMLEHHEYHNQFEMADLLHDYKYDPESQVNPFLHIACHQIIENQLESREPIEALQFYNSMRQNRVSRHEAIHCIANILVYLLPDVLQGIAPFDIEKYRLLLKKLKNKKPEKLMPALEREFNSD